MKVIIFLSTFLICTALNVLIGIFTGIKLGSVLLYVLAFAIARKLSESFEKRQRQKSPATKHNHD